MDVTSRKILVASYQLSSREKKYLCKGNQKPTQIKNSILKTNILQNEKISGNCYGDIM
jgi:hypothetical protein